MKIQIHFLFTLLFSFTLFPNLVYSQTTTDNSQLELPGDNFCLEGALELFKKSESPEDFEEKLNSEESQVNNLDLNEDGDIDYIRVVDNMDGDVHALVLQVPVGEEESQDIAVIEIEKTADKEAMLQIIGDELLYGENHIVEPFDLEASDGGRGPSVAVSRVVFNVWAWPSVRFMYRPAYTVWVSPFRYRHYPRWWKPWRPRPVKVFVGYRAPYRPHYRVTTTHRVVRAHRVYAPKRRTSKVVHTRTTTRVASPNKKDAVAGKKTTTTKTVRGPQGGKVTRKKTTTTVKGKKGRSAKKKTTTTKARKGRKG